MKDDTSNAALSCKDMMQCFPLLPTPKTYNQESSESIEETIWGFKKKRTNMRSDR